MKYVYEFTNQRKLTKAEFLKWFQKKVLYTIRKFEMIRNNDVVAYENKGDFRGVVLEDVLKMFSEKGNVEIMKLPAFNSQPTTPKKLLTKNPFVNSHKKFRAKRGKVKIAIPFTIDTESNKLVYKLIKGNAKNLKSLAPVKGKVIKPLYLFLDKEVLLYAKLKKLKYTPLGVPQEGASTSSRPQSIPDGTRTSNEVELGGKDKISDFIDDLEKKHPEIKRAIISSYLELH